MKKPDIIFLHTDQWSHRAFSADKSDVVLTPASDRMFAEGMRFESAVASAPICVPNRSSWYTGLMPSEHGNLANGRPWTLRPDAPDLGQWLSAKGYDCYYGGKWHVTGRSERASFQVFFGGHPLGEIMDDGLAQSAEALLASRKSDKPFFLNVGIMNPHDCCYIDLSNNADYSTKFGIQPLLDLPDNPPDYDPSRPIQGRPDHWNAGAVRLYRYYYYRMCEMADQALARIHAAVQQYCDPDNTIVIYSSDHGEFNGHRNLLKKGLLYDPAQRVPLSISGPGIRAGSINTTHIPGAVDVTATILDYAGVEPMPDMQFAASLRPVLEGRSDAPLHEYTPTETLQGGLTHGFRAGEFKSIFNATRKTTELYHLPSDPFEQRNLAKVPDYADTMAQHQGFYEDFKSRVKLSPGCRQEWQSAGLL
jgi:arylsulfatase A-like enzyme